MTYEGPERRVFKDRRKDSLITINMAMKLVSVTRRTIYNWIYSGKVKVVRVSSGAYRIYKSSLFMENEASQKFRERLGENFRVNMGREPKDEDEAER